MHETNLLLKAYYEALYERLLANKDLMAKRIGELLQEFFDVAIFWPLFLRPQIFRLPPLIDLGKIEPLKSPARIVLALLASGLGHPSGPCPGK